MEAVTVAERACGKNHPKVSLFLNHLADIHRKQGRYHYCKPEYERVIAIMRREHGSEYLELVDPMMGLAAVCKKLGEYSVCETLLNQCMKVVTQVFGAEHPKMALALQALGDVHRKQMEQVDKTKNVEKHTALRVKAKTMYLHSIEINKQAFNGQSNIEVAEALRSLSLIVEDTKQAVAHMREAMNIVTERLGPQHPKFAMLWNTLGDVLFKSGDEIGALQAYSFAYEGNCKLFKDRELGHPEIAHALFGKGRCAVASGSHAEAETHLLASISMTEATLGPKSPNLRARVIALAKCYLAWGAHDTEAQQVLESVGIYDFAAIE
jgi:tetratricopeptide (TPR) repeat protein